MALGILKFAGAIVGGVKKFITKRKEKKELKIQRKIDSAIQQRERLNEFSQGIFGTAGGESSVVKQAGEALSAIKNFNTEGGGEEAKKDGLVIGGKSDLPSWLLPVAGILAAVLILPKLLGGRRSR